MQSVVKRTVEPEVQFRPGAVVMTAVAVVVVVLSDGRGVVVGDCVCCGKGLPMVKLAIDMSHRDSS